MAPPRRRISAVGQLLRAAREALHVDQKGFGALCFVSDRTVSRWENGAWPTPQQANTILNACMNLPDALFSELASALGVEDEAPAAAPPPLVVPAPAPAPVRASNESMRATLDAVLYAAAEERDVLPRHLRAFAVELLQAADKLGVTTREAAELVAVREKTTAAKTPSATE